MKRGTHGIVAVRIVVVIAAGRVEIIRVVSIVVIAGTQPGVIHSSDRPKSADFRGFFKIISTSTILPPVSKAGK